MVLMTKNLNRLRKLRESIPLYRPFICVEVGILMAIVMWMIVTSVLEKVDVDVIENLIKMPSKIGWRSLVLKPS